ncbi:hypothetical protein RBH26_08440 [Natronolimnohabitans sp. A-GB9]|uniref:hypothetical protein n=1 Tax=Natronolimnohabitans sp. A-GB9 TaxID=3069757 RepID=UPI0027B04943|nr:hypothetical protein [Natronolimnohabitans sp. A-GB9]MDQ2050514.1 hypothetical protein [Natronolimnohabitans sp. A-GB9]
MSEEHDNDLSAEIPTETVEELASQRPVEAATAVTPGDKRGLLSLAGGGVLLLSALKSLRKGQLRALPKGAVAAGLLSYGLRRQRSSGPETFEPVTDEVEGGTDDKDVSDQAHAAAERPDSGRESQIDASGEVDDASQLGDEGDTGERVEFTEDAEGEEPRTKPEHVGEEEDPRRDTDDETVEIDVSETAMAEETSEATGPDPEQAQPSQTDSIEPEESPEEDASDMKVEPGEDSDSASDEPDESASEGDEDETEDR